MTTINIGTTTKNITGVEIDKPFDEIKIEDIWEIVAERFGTRHHVTVIGWVDVTKEEK